MSIYAGNRMSLMSSERGGKSFVPPPLRESIALIFTPYPLHIKSKVDMVCTMIRHIPTIKMRGSLVTERKKDSVLES